MKVLRGMKGEKGFYLMTVIVERKMPKIMVMARLAHLARIISHGTKIMAINRLVLVLSAVLITGGMGMTSGSADIAIQNLRESYYFTLIRVLGGDPIPPIITSVIEP